MLAWLGTTVLTQAWLWLSWEAASTTQFGHATPSQARPSRQPCRNQTIRHRVLALFLQPKFVIIWSCAVPLLISWLRLRSKQDNSDGTCSPHCAAQQMTWKPLSTQLSSAYHILTAATPADAKFQGSFVFKYKTYNNTPRSPCNILWPTWLRYAKLNFYWFKNIASQ